MVKLIRLVGGPAGIITLSLIFLLITNFFIFSVKKSGDFWGLALIGFESVLGMLVLPLLSIKFLIGEFLEDFGWRWPKINKDDLLLMLASVFLLVPFILFFSTQESFVKYYSLQNISVVGFLFRAVLFSGIYFVAEEFLFRGFLFWGLWHKLGYHSFWITSLIFAFFHVAKPPLEIIFSFYASIIFCYLSFKTKSFLPAAFVHFLIAFVLNVLVTYAAGY